MKTVSGKMIDGFIERFANIVQWMLRVCWQHFSIISNFRTLSFYVGDSEKDLSLREKMATGIPGMRVL